MRLPSLIKKIFFNQIWDVPNNKNNIYLTFDDGPMPAITDWVLDLLEKENIKATFFCIGDNIQKHPNTFFKIIDNKHAIGNHTFNHLNGWKTTTAPYLKNIALCQEVLHKHTSKPCTLFRPPYGRIKPSQSKKIRQLGYKIIMWRVLSKDYDAQVSKEKCVENVVKNTKSGDIIVFHDSIKAFEKLKYALPLVIKQLKDKGFNFEVLS